MTTAEAIALLTTRRDNARKSGWTDPALQADVEAYATALDMGIEAIERTRSYRGVISNQEAEERFKKTFDSLKDAMEEP